MLRHGGTRALKYFLLSFNGTSRLYYSWNCSGTTSECFSKCFSSCAVTATRLIIILYMYMQLHFRLSLCETTQARKCVQCRMTAAATAVLKVHVQGPS